MIKQIFVFLALFASASAFVPPATGAGFVAPTALNMVKNTDVSKGIAAAAAGFVPAILSSTAAIATEGTNEWFGVDDTRLLAVLFVGHLAILSLWLGSYGDAKEDVDFFGEIDYTGERHRGARRAGARGSRVRVVERTHAVRRGGDVGEVSWETTDDVFAVFEDCR